MVDQIVEKEVQESYTQEVRTYAVRALYPYQSKTFNLVRGEVLELKEKSNEEWWLVENSSCKEGFAPANYLKEIGIQKIAKQRVRFVKYPEIVKVKRVVPKTSNKVATAVAVATVLLLNQNKSGNKAANKSRIRRKTTSIQPRELQHLSTENLLKRQVDINFLYNQLFTGSIQKRKQLDDSIAFYKWLRKFEELDRWIKERRQNLGVDKETSLLENPDAAKRRYQAFNTDFLANQSEFVEITKLASVLTAKKTNFTSSNLIVTSEQIEQKQLVLNNEWLALLELKKYWDNAVKAIQCIDRFNLLYVDVSDLLREKLNSSIQDDLSSDITDIKSVRALQSKQDKLERDIEPLETNVGELKRTADEVCKYFPHETKNVQRKLAQVEDLWFKLRDDVRNRKAKLDEKHGLQRFENEVHDFQQVCLKIKSLLAELDAPRDLSQCEDMEKKFADIEQELSNEVAFKFNDLKKLSQSQLAKRGVIGSVEKINSQLNQMAQEKNSIAALLDDKRVYLSDFHKYLKFKQDANNFELLMIGQVIFKICFNILHISLINGLA